MALQYEKSGLKLLMLTILCINVECLMSTVEHKVGLAETSTPIKEWKLSTFSGNYDRPIKGQRKVTLPKEEKDHEGSRKRILCSMIEWTVSRSKAST